jgi:hypothetical protein
MTLRIRRGTEAQRAGVTFDLGELAWTTDTKKLYVGDASTAGGVNIAYNIAGTGLTYDSQTQKIKLSAGINDLDDVTITGTPTVGHSIVWNGSAWINGPALLQEDITPYLGGNLNLNSFDITGTGNIDITGTIQSSGDLILDGNEVSGTGNVDITGNLVASGTLSVTIGLGDNLALNGHDIDGSGNINITGSITNTGLTTVTGSFVLNSQGFGRQGMIVTGEASGGDTSALLNIGSARANTTPLQNNDLLGSYSLSAYNGLDYHKGSVLFAKMASGYVGGDPNKFAVDTGLYTLNPDGRFRQFWFRNSGLFEALGIAYVGASTAEINGFAAIAPEGATAYNTDLNKLVLYTGTVAETMLTSVAPPTHSYGQAGDQIGMLAFDATYIYYCFANYVNNSTDIWKRTPHAAGTW